MGTSREMNPTDDQLKVFIGGLLTPKLNQISTDSERHLILSGFIMAGGEITKAIAPFSIGNLEKPQLNGDLRLRFREAFGNRILLNCQCIFQRDQAVHNCSGFLLKGELKGETIKCTGWTIHYSVWDWTV